MINKNNSSNNNRENEKSKKKKNKIHPLAIVISNRIFAFAEAEGGKTEYCRFASLLPIGRVFALCELCICAP